MTGPYLPLRRRVPQRFWVGLVAVVVYVLGAAVIANLLTGWMHPRDPAVDFALGHFPVLLPLIVGGILFVRRNGWSAEVWRTPAAFETTPKRWWLLSIPVLMLTNAIITLATAPADRWALGPVLLLAVVLLLVGLGEELYFRGILRASLRAHHGETLTLLVTSLFFGLAHSVAALAGGVPISIVAFMVATTGFTAVLYYAAFRATGRLWVPILLHALDDFALELTDGALIPGVTSAPDPGTLYIGIQMVIWLLAAVFLVSCVRQDLRARKEPHVQTSARR